MLDRNFGNIVWTDHALEKLRERGIKQGDAWATWRRPDQSRYAANKGAWVYYRTFPTSPRLRGASGQKIEVVAKQNEKKVGDPNGKWIILSVWSRPVYGTTKKSESLLKLLLRRIFKK